MAVPLALRRARSASWTYAFPIKDAGSHEQGDAKADLHDLLDGLAVAQPAQDQYAGEGRRDGTDHEPLDELEVHGPATEMDEAAEGFITAEATRSLDTAASG